MMEMEEQQKKRPVLGARLLPGMGFGNQLFVYASVRCLAKKNGCGFAVVGRDILEKTLTLKDGRLMDLDYGEDLPESAFDRTIAEKDERIYLPDSMHDLTNGCYITGTDDRLFTLGREQQNILLTGNLQSWDYLAGMEEEFGKWFSVPEKFEHFEYASDDICVLNIRGGEYAGAPELFLRRKYWLDAMRCMRAVHPAMRFVAVTDDPEAAGKVLPEVRAVHGDLAHDYTIIRNAHWLILSNSSFACFPAFTGQAKKIIAPKYWARHNVSDGFWASEQNIYPAFTYLDRDGKLFTAGECREELAAYREKSGLSEKIGKKPTDEEMRAGGKKVQALRRKDMEQRALLSLRRRLHLIHREKD